MPNPVFEVILKKKSFLQISILAAVLSLGATLAARADDPTAQATQDAKKASQQATETAKKASEQATQTAKQASEQATKIARIAADQVARDIREQKNYVKEIDVKMDANAGTSFHDCHLQWVNHQDPF